MREKEEPVEIACEPAPSDKTAFEKHFAVFMDILNDAAGVYESHIPEKGEAWMTCDPDQLWTPWLTEVGEVLARLGGRYNPHKVRQELLDVINQSLMLAKRLDELEG